MTRKKSPREERQRVLLAVLDAHVRHARSTTQREDAAAELGMDLAAYGAAVEEARRLGFEVDRVPRLERQPIVGRGITVGHGHAADGGRRHSRSPVSSA